MLRPIHPVYIELNEDKDTRFPVFHLSKLNFHFKIYIRGGNEQATARTASCRWSKRGLPGLGVSFSVPGTADLESGLN